MNPTDGQETQLGDEIPAPKTTRFESIIDDDMSSFSLLDHDLLPALNTKYEVVEEIGRGGVGVVYRARDIDLDRDLALKVLLPSFVDRPGIAELFANEACIMGSLQHPGIAHVYERGLTTDGRPFHAMKLVNGETFFSMLRSKARTPGIKHRLLGIFSHVCQTIAYTHSQNIVHLDLKPSNIMVGAFGEVHVMDWGLAKSISKVDVNKSKIGWAEDGPISSDPNRVHGTPQYMSPEQACAGILDKQSDVFALGAILCEILTGKPLYEGESVSEVLGKAQVADLQTAFEHLDSCTSEVGLVRLVKRCLQAKPIDRPADASEVAKEMVEYGVSELEQVESDMTRFFELSLDLFCITNFEGYFRRINSNFSRVLGYSDRELLSRPFLDFVLEADKQNTIAEMSKLFEGQPVVRFRNRYLTADGKVVTFEWTSKSIPAENLIFAVARNVT